MGSATNGAKVVPGDVVVVYGVGGVGINAVQGASHSGAVRAIAVDPIAFKRDVALKLGATDAYATHEEAMDLRVPNQRSGRGLGDSHGRGSHRARHRFSVCEHS